MPAGKAGTAQTRSRLQQPSRLRHVPASRCMPMLQDTDPDATEPARHPLRVRTVWISDLHLGTPGCQAAALLDFLRDVECETLYLVGDIIDGWQLRRSWYWPQAHNDVVQKILRKARKGTRVVFVPGNHDEFARRYVAHNFGGVDVVEDCIHVTADGRRLWVTHGDLFDGVIQCAKWLAYVGDMAYEFTLKVNRWFNRARARLGPAVLEPVALPQAQGQARRQLRRRLRGRGGPRSAARAACDGVVCGHIHHAEMREIDGVLYCNDGDWVESLTALVEHADGRLEIIDRSAPQRGNAAGRAGRTARTDAPSRPGRGTRRRSVARAQRAWSSAASVRRASVSSRRRCQDAQHLEHGPVVQGAHPRPVLGQPGQQFRGRGAKRPHRGHGQPQPHARAPTARCSAPAAWSRRCRR